MDVLNTVKMEGMKGLKSLHCREIGRTGTTALLASAWCSLAPLEPCDRLASFVSCQLLNLVGAGEVTQHHDELTHLNR